MTVGEILLHGNSWAESLLWDFGLFCCLVVFCCIVKSICKYPFVTCLYIRVYTRARPVILCFFLHLFTIWS